MPNTTTVACSVGYDLYLTYAANGGMLTIDQINAHLANKGYPPISARTYKHYGSLHRHRYDHYIPINQLDVAVSRRLV